MICDGMSDHYPCLLTLYTDLSDSDVFIDLRKITSESISHINQRLLFTDWSPMQSLSVHGAAEFLRDKITDALDAEAPKKTKRLNHKDVIREPWMSVQLLKYTKKSRRLCKKANESKNPLHFAHYKNYRNTLNRLKCLLGVIFTKNCLLRLEKILK